MKKKQSATQRGQTRPGKSSVKLTLFERIGSQYPKAPVLLLVVLSLAILAGVAMFDPRVSISGDDTAYIERAWNFWHHGILPGYQGPLYPVLLAPFTGLFGINLWILKSLSFLCILGFIYFLFRSLAGRIPFLLLATITSITAMNGFVLYYASQTYSEAMYMCLQSVVMLYFFRYFTDAHEGKGYFSEWRTILVLVLIMLALGAIRFIGFTAFVAAGICFLLAGQWRRLTLFSAMTILIAVLVIAGMELLNPAELDSFFTRLQQRSTYVSGQGNESATGYFTRLFLNSDLYLSRHVYIMAGFRENMPMLPVKTFLTILFVALLAAGLATAYRHNRYILFAGIYATVFCIVTFVTVSVIWDQSRLIVPVYPILLLVVLAGPYYLFERRTLKDFQWIIAALSAILLLTNLRTTYQAVATARDHPKTPSGFTPDWDNYIAMSRWVAGNLPDSALVACRKPSISFIYSNGRKFYGILRLPTWPADPVLQAWKADPEAWIAVPPKQVFEKKLPPDLEGLIGRNLSAVAIQGNTGFGLIRTGRDSSGHYLARFGEYSIRCLNNYDLFAEKFMGNREGFYAIYPDSLLHQLKSAGVTHILTASLRLNTTKKTGQTINTVENFLMLLSVKYPGIAYKIAQHGSDDNEPASIYRLNLGAYHASDGISSRVSAEHW